MSTALRTGLCFVLSLAFLVPHFTASSPSSAQTAGLQQSASTPTQLASAVTAAPPDSANVEISVGASESWIEALLEFLILGIITILLLAVVGAFTGGFAAVSIFMETGCLRFVVFGLGWVPACIAGFLVGIFLSESTGWDVLMETGLQVGFLGYPIGWAWGLRRANQLPREEYLTWKHTLTGGALLGTGAGSALSFTRAAGLLFKGGGGSFGGGGASGSLSSAPSVSAAAAASSGSVSATGAVALGGTGSGATATGKQTVSERTAPSSKASWMRRRLHKVGHRIRSLRWYHVAAFMLIVLIFVPVGLGVATWLQNPDVLIFVTAAAALIGGYRLSRRWTASAASSSRKDSDFRGGGASDSWE